MQTSAPHILLVEDDENDAVLFRLALKRAGKPYTLEIVPDTAKAMEYLQVNGTPSVPGKHPLPQLVFLDLHLRNEDGMQLLRWLRAQPHLDKVVLLVTSGTMDPKNEELSKNLGARFLPKPVPVAELAALLEA
ncbi:MAG TPA: response regulator [Candidatus Saccharimonadales bacterium]|nr:response regulator [Candidatus Saccharimonadales bacterium]